MKKEYMVDKINYYVLGEVSAVDLGLNDDQITAIYNAFCLHDIKQLSEDEYDAIVEELAEEIVSL